MAGGRGGANEKFGAMEAAGFHVTRSPAQLGTTMMRAMGLMEKNERKEQCRMKTEKLGNLE